jgi:hypothetical protein
MTRFPNDDKDLVNFLRQHRPEVPPASADLEQQILRHVETLHATSLRTPNLRHRSPLWLVPSTIAAGLVAAVISYDAFIPAQPSPAELAKLERFMESNWQGVVSDNPDSDVFSMTDSSNKL